MKKHAILLLLFLTTIAVGTAQPTAEIHLTWNSGTTTIDAVYIINNSHSDQHTVDGSFMVRAANQSGETGSMETFQMYHDLHPEKHSNYTRKTIYLPVSTHTNQISLYHNNKHLQTVNVTVPDSTAPAVTQKGVNPKLMLLAILVLGGVTGYTIARRRKIRRLANKHEPAFWQALSSNKDEDKTE